MSLQVIGAGYGRTGTNSLKEALVILGYSHCYHMEDVFLHKRGHENLWLNVSEGNPDWDTIFEGCKAAVDFPASNYYTELAEHFPESKIVLTTRDFDKWHKSTHDTIYQHGDPPFPQIITWKLFPFLNRFHKMANACIWKRKDGKFFDGEFLDKAACKKKFEDHIADVKKTIPADRLLCWDVKEGWEPLCKFLNKPVPKEPFPHSQLTDGPTMKKMSQVFAVVGVVSLVAFPVTIPMFTCLWAVDALFLNKTPKKKKAG
ncbi:hypothetical protein CYMTET_52924 [Cymbomonas tetramitiformis]|uniref:NAD dependent epimerase/dehydratase n=1 Tax=Cymbomonas tetramitiformis TaxID=36881 RepID=A0AAE0BJ78_9CHLO|nr:hypothetical protein CYMTET_52924 [Cymbomonas tetramitiformis]